MAHEPLIADLINAKRAAGYDSKFESLLRERWYCPTCKAGKTILSVLLPFPRPLIVIYGCSDCNQPGIRHLADRADEQMTQLLDAIEPFNRSGTA